MAASSQTPAPFPRRAQRTAFVKETVVHLQHDDGRQEELHVQIRDYSPVGIGLVTDRLLHRDQQFTLNLAAGDGRPAEMLYNVAHCRQQADGRYQIGAEFVCMTLQSGSPDLPPNSMTLRDRIRRAMLT